MGEPLVQGVASRLDDVAWRIEIGLPDLEVDDIAALRFQRSRLHQHFESGLGAETRHAFGEAKFIRCGLIHNGQPSSATSCSCPFEIVARAVPRAIDEKRAARRKRTIFRLVAANGRTNPLKHRIDKKIALVANAAFEFPHPQCSQEKTAGPSKSSDPWQILF